MHRYEKFTILFFGEGASEKKFFVALEKSDKFKSQFDKAWNISIDNASGSACKIILGKCICVCQGRSFDLIFCFIDTDKLYQDYPKNFIEERDKLEKVAEENNIIIIWQEKNHEEELSKAIEKKVKKRKVKKMISENEIKLMNSDFVKKILIHISDYQAKNN